MKTFTHTNSHASINLTQEEEGLWLEWTPRAPGQERRRVPLLRVEVYSKAEFRAETLRQYRVDAVESVANGFHVTVGDTARGVRLGLWIELLEGELSVQLPLAELYEDKFATYRVFTVLPLQGLVTADAAGVLLLPLNTGYLCFPREKARASDRFMIYGEQSRWELMPMLPVCGGQSENGGLVALARQGAAETQCHVSTDGQGNGEVGLDFSIRQNWPDPVEFETREIRYVPVPEGADLVHFAAKRLRRHVMDDLGKPTLAQRAQESPEVEYLLQATIIKLFLAVEHVGIMMADKTQASPLSFVRTMTFSQAADCLTRVREAGIDKVLTQSVGWNPRGHDGLWPTRFPIDKRLGGEAGFRALIAYGHGLGFQMNVHDNYLAAYRNSPDFREDQIIRDIFGEAMGLGEWGGGVTFVPWALGLPEERLEGEMRRVKALGLSGAGYIDAMGNPLYRNYDPRQRGTRTDYARGTQRILAASRAVHGATGTECGFLYAAIGADSMVTGGSEWQASRCWPEWPITGLMDKRVPVWQLALHGLIILENHGENWCDTMKAVLFGDHPRSEWSAEPGVMPVLTDSLLGAIKARHDLVLGQFGHLQTQELIRHFEVGHNVFESQFEDGTLVRADFVNEELFVNEKYIARPAALAGSSGLGIQLEAVHV